MKSGCRQRQTGAVTLMGALFVIITLALMGQAISHMTVSSSIDITTQNDAVEALFIAETGIEYASYLYANNTSCPELNTSIGNIHSGRGNFDVTASTTNGSDCRITVQARVSSTGASPPNSALRTINADLHLSEDESGVIVSLVRWQEQISN